MHGKGIMLVGRRVTYIYMYIGIQENKEKDQNSVCIYTFAGTVYRY